MSLVKALEIYTKLQGNPHSQESLTAGLPITNDPLDFTLLQRAAQRIGLEIKQEKRSIRELFHFAMPCIIILNDKKWAVLLNTTHDEATLILMDHGEQRTQLSLKALEEVYTGEVIFLTQALRPPSTYFSTFRWFFDILKQHRSLYVQAIIAGGIVNLFLIITTFYVLIVYDRVIPHQGFDTLWVLTLGVIIIYLFDGILRIVRSYVIDEASKKADLQLGAQLFEHIMNTKMESRPHSSTAMAFHLKEFESLREFLSSSTLVTLSDLPYTLLLLLVIGLIGGHIVWIPILGIMLILAVSILVQPSLADYVKRLNQVTENKYSVLINAIANLEVVKCFNMHRQVQTQWETTLSSSAEVGNELKGFNHIVLAICSFLQNLSYIFVIVAGVYMISSGHLTFGGLIACSILTSRAIVPIHQVTSLIARFNQSIYSIKELSHIMNLPQERRTDITYQSRPDFKGTIQFINVDFSYPNQYLKSLKNFTLTIPAGERIGLIGRVGSGKTTLEKLVLGLYRPSYGHILIDGIEHSQIDPFELRKYIGYVPQDVCLWRGTLKHNILSGAADIPEEQFLKACDLSGVSEFVRFHPLGFNMMIAEDGSGLSQGQKQAVAIARALVHTPKILLMDEPTASMDPESELLFIDRLNKYLTNQTVIAITHRVPVLNLVKRVALIEQGQLLMEGPRDQVIARINEAHLKTKNQQNNSLASSASLRESDDATS
jgi:ATP-binding cassette, subfamily C, bacterial LapB